MNVRLAERGVRVRIDPPDLAALARGEIVAFEVTGPLSLRCELVMDEDGASSVVFGEGILRVTLAAELVERLKGAEVEEVAFGVALADGRELRCEVEKDRRTFAPRHKPARRE